jgi:hypothetical protein
MGLAKTDSRPCYVYRWFAFTGQLLYVGCAKDPDKRWAEIRNVEDWPRFAARRTLERYDTVGEALAAELEAIKTESPLFNLNGIRRRRRDGRAVRFFELADGSRIRCERNHVQWVIGLPEPAAGTAS